MAAPVVSSTSTVQTFGTTGNITITPPSGIQDGDILLLVVGMYSTTPSGVTVSGFTAIASEAVSTSTSSTKSFYKVASSESGNYTIAGVGADGGAAVMFRITGDTTSLFNFDTEQDESAVATIVKQSPSLLVMFGHSRDNIGHSGYTITHGGSNPTWTEVYDVAGTTPDQAFFCAYATTTDTTDITAWSYTETIAATNTAQLIVSLSEQNVTGTLTTLTSPPTLQSVPGSSGTTATLTTLTSSPTLQSVSGKGLGSTQWTNESVETTNWINET